MKKLKYLVLAGAMLLGLENTVAQNRPEFRRDFVADTKTSLATAKGPIQWSGRTYEVHNSPTREVYELRGYINMPIRALGFLGIYRFHLGAITRIDGDNIESIIYVSNRPKETLSEYDRKIAAREGINLDGICSLWHEKYTPNTIINLETGEVRARNGAAEFQTVFFNILQGDTIMKINFCGDIYNIGMQRYGNITMADLTEEDPKNPGERKKLQPPILSISAHSDSNGLPDKMTAVAELKFPALTFHPEATYDKSIPWKERR